MAVKILIFWTLMAKNNNLMAQQPIMGQDLPTDY